MITALHKKRWELFFKIYSAFYLKRVFFDVRYSIQNINDSINVNENTNLSESPNVDKNRSILLISNHFSFWDGFIHMLLSNKFFKKKIFIMMLQDQLDKNIFLRYGGCFSVAKGSRGVMESLNYSIEKLKERGNMLLIFPQGQTESLYTTDFKFQKGVSYIRDRSPNSEVWFNVNLINFYSLKKPVLNMYLAQYSGPTNQLENSFNNYAALCRSKESEQIKGKPLL